MLNLHTEAYRRQLITNVSAAAFTIAAGGIFTKAQIEALALPKQWNADPTIAAPSFRGGRAIFFGTAAATTTHDYRWYCGWKIEGRNNGSDSQYLVLPMVFGQFTLGTMVGLTDLGAVKTTERFAHTIVSATLTTAGTSPAGPGDFFNSYLNGVGLKSYSPSDNTVAFLGLSELGNPAVQIMDLKAASGDINASFARDI